MNKLDQELVTVVADKVRQYAPKVGTVTKKLTASNVLVGVEIELENFHDPRGNCGNMLAAGWKEMVEGSLVNGREFAMYPPRNGGDIVRTIDSFFGAGFKYTTGERTSIHIHVDMLDGTTVGQLRSMLGLILALEGPIYRSADENRKWGSYSCPLTDMTPERWNELIAGDRRTQIARGMTGIEHEDKYFGCNAASIRKHGTLEFRYFPCTTDKAKLMAWVNMCIELKVAGSKFDSPEEMCAALGNEAALRAFMELNMPVTYETLIPYMDFDDSIRRIRAVKAIVTDPLAARPYADEENYKRSPAIRRFLEYRKGTKPAKPAKPAFVEMGDDPVHVGEQVPLGDLHDMIMRQRRIARAALAAK